MLLVAVNVNSLSKCSASSSSGNSMENEKESWLKAKRSVIVIEKTADNLCMTRAICISKAFADGMIRRSAEWRTLMRQASQVSHFPPALNLCKQAGIASHGPHNLQDLMTIQNSDMFRNQYRIIVFNYQNNNEVIFDGGVYHFLAGGKILPLCYCNEHYNAITTVTGFLEATHFCNFCLKPGFSRSDNTVRALHTCDYVCKFCYGDCFVDANRTDIKCTSCGRVFRNQRCYDNHNRKDGHNALFTTRSVCETKFVCKLCGMNKQIYFVVFISFLICICICSLCTYIFSSNFQDTFTMVCYLRNMAWCTLAISNRAAVVTSSIMFCFMSVTCLKFKHQWNDRLHLQAVLQ